MASNSANNLPAAGEGAADRALGSQERRLRRRRRRSAQVAEQREGPGAVLAALRALPGGEGAARIGQVTAARPGQVVLRNAFGGSRILAKLTGAQLPRIC